MLNTEVRMQGETTRGGRTLRPDALLRELYRLYDSGDYNALFARMADQRSQINWSLVDRGDSERSPLVSVESSDREIVVRPIGPRIDERKALIIRTEVNRALLAHPGRLEELIVDLSEITSVSASVLTLLSDLKRNARVFGAEIDAIGISEETRRAIRHLRLGRTNEHHERKHGLQRVLRSLLPVE
jgi:anti-anti-sigma regulatory factor